MPLQASAAFEEEEMLVELISSSYCVLSQRSTLYRVLFDI